MGGKRPGAGRPLGSRSKSTIAREKIAGDGLITAIKTGFTPLQILLARMRKQKLPDGTMPDDDQVRMAIESAPYIHSKLASTEVQMSSENTHFVMSDAPLTADEWVAKYNIGVAASDNNAAVEGEGTEAPERKANGTNGAAGTESTVQLERKADGSGT